MRSLIATFTALVVLVSAQATLTFTIDYTQDSLNFFNTQAKKDALQGAANYVGGLLANTSLGSITSGGSNHYDAIISNPGTGSSTTFSDTSVVANNIVIYAGGRNLGGSTLALAGPAGFNLTGSQPFIDSVLFRGNGSFSMTSVGSISFTTSSSFTFYFDDDPTTVESGAMAGKVDFFSVAIHELGHVLGIGLNNSWTSLASGSHTFLGGASTAANGGSAPALTSDNGHWASGTNSTVFGTSTVQEASLSPTITLGQRKFFTTLDVAGLSDIGFTATAVPEPADFALGAGAIGMLWCIYRRRRAAPVTSAR